MRTLIFLLVIFLCLTTMVTALGPVNVNGPLNIAWDKVTLNEDGSPAVDIEGYYVMYDKKQLSEDVIQARADGCAEGCMKVSKDKTSATLDLEAGQWYVEVIPFDEAYNLGIHSVSEPTSTPGTFSSPVDISPFTITSCFGWRKIQGKADWHQGIDINLIEGVTPVKAIGSGIVMETCTGSVNKGARDYTRKCGGYGNYIIIAHPDGHWSMYNHLDRVIVTPSQYVMQGEQIGFGGNTGYSFGAHLDLKIAHDDQVRSPNFGPRIYSHKFADKQNNYIFNPLCYVQAKYVLAGNSCLDTDGDSTQSCPTTLSS